MKLDQIAAKGEKQLKLLYSAVTLFCIIFSVAAAYTYLVLFPFAVLRILTVIGLCLFSLIIGRLMIYWRQRDILAMTQRELDALTLKLDDLAQYCLDHPMRAPLLAKILQRQSAI
ncbi:MAG: hypothetical protein WC966_10355 [Bradymonadales bacterium]|jgi:hypothetical protein